MLAEIELQRRVEQVIGVLAGFDIGDRLAILGVIAAALFSELPAEKRGGIADAWFEIIVLAQPKP